MAEHEPSSGGSDPPGVSNAELRVLQSLWDHGPSTIRQLTERLYPAVTPANYATVQKLLERLEKDRCVRRDRTDTPHVFAAAITRDTYIGGQLRAMAERLCGGSLTPLLTHLVKTESLSAKERSDLRKMLDRPGMSPGPS
ncbi:MAG: blaI 7 [Gemmataceae bacterium]|nr:blaI 7 [Gemmataceae bacterium]